MAEDRCTSLVRISVQERELKYCQGEFVDWGIIMHAWFWACIFFVRILLCLRVFELVFFILYVDFNWNNIWTWQSSWLQIQFWTTTKFNEWNKFKNLIGWWLDWLLLWTWIYVMYDACIISIKFKDYSDIRLRLCWVEEFVVLIGAVYNPPRETFAVKGNRRKCKMV